MRGVLRGAASTAPAYPDGVIVRLIGVVMVGLALVILRRPKVTANWTTRLNSDLFDRGTSAGERRGTTAIAIAASVLLLALGAYYVVRGGAALPD